MKKLIILSLIALMGMTGLVMYKTIAPNASYSDQQKDAPRRGIAKAMAYLTDVRAHHMTGKIDVKDVYSARQQADDLKLAKSACADDKKPIVWDEIGPNNVGGRTRTLVIDRNNRNRLYTAGVAGGIWISDDRGANWKPHPSNFTTNLNISAMAQGVDGTLYVGTGEGFTSGNSADGKAFSAFVGTGMYRSTDNGETFELLSATEPAQFSSTTNWAFVNRIVVHPTNENILYVTTNRGVWKSEDKGISWDRPAGLTVGSEGWDIDIDQNGKVYAAVGAGLYVAADGEPFVNIAGQNGVPSVNRRKRVAVSPTDPNFVYFITTTPAGCLDRVVQSTDGGNLWVEIGRGGSVTLLPFGFGDGSCQGWYDLAFTVDAANPNRIFVGGLTVWTWSSDLGWNQLNAYIATANELFVASQDRYIHADIHEIIFDKEQPNIVYITSDGGISRSNNAQEPFPSFKTLNKGYNVTQFYSVAASIDGQVMGGTQDNGTPHFSYDYNSIRSSDEVTGGDGGYTEISDINPLILISESQFGTMRRSTNGGDAFNGFFDENINPPADRGTPFRGPFLTTFLLWEDLNEFYFGSGAKRSKFFTGGNQANLWMTKDVLNPTVTPHWESLGRFEDGQPLSAASVSSEGSIVYATSIRGSLIRVTNLDGDNPTTTRFTNSLFRGRYTTGIAVDPSNPSTLVVVAGNYGNTDHIWMSVDAFGSNSPSFESIQYDLPRMPIYDVTFTLDFEHQIIVATELGIWSYNALTQCWSEQNEGMGRVPVHRVRVEPIKESFCNALYIGTHGRGLFKSYSLVDTSIPSCQDLPNPVFDSGVTSVETTATNVTEEDFSIQIFPNPVQVNANIIIELPNTTQQAQMSIVDLQGKLIQQQALPTGQDRHVLPFNRGDLSAGMYLIQVETPNAKASHKMMIAK